MDGLLEFRVFGEYEVPGVGEVMVVWVVWGRDWEASEEGQEGGVDPCFPIYEGPIDIEA